MNIEEYKALKAEEVEKAKEEPTTETPQVEEPKVETQEKTKVEPKSTYKVGDQEVTIDELTQGYLRQSDYTKKTTDLSMQKQELADAVSIYQMVQKDPKLRSQLAEAGGDKKILAKASAESKRISELEKQLANMQLDSTLTDLKHKYPDFDETTVLTEASKRGIADLEFVYKAVRSEQAKSEPVDVDALKAQIRAELEAEKGGTIPPTLMDGRSGSTPTADDGKPTISALEHRIASAMGLTDEEYIKNRDV